MCRAIGLPCRCVTNYVSAHDTNASISVDKFYDEDGEEIAEGAGAAHAAASGGGTSRPDSIWNFHVWNEVN